MTSGGYDQRPTPDSTATDRAARVLAQALLEAEVILGADRESRTQPVVVESLDRIGEILGRLVDHTEQLAARMADLTDAVGILAQTRPVQQPQLAPEPAKPQLPEMEPSFSPGGEGVDVTIGAVPGFQGLMEVQRALVRLPQVVSAAVRRYQDDEAAIQLVLGQPMTATAIAEAVTSATGQQLIVDEARVEALRLRLRFLS